MGRRSWLAVSALLVAAVPVWADSHDVNQHQSEHQEQAAVAAQQQKQEAAQANVQDSHDELQRQNVVQSSPNLYLGQAEEGAQIVSPWGSASAGKQAEMTKLAVAHSIVTSDEGKAAIEAQALEAIKPCRWLGVGPKRFSVLFGWDCWTSLRK